MAGLTHLGRNQEPRRSDRIATAVTRAVGTPAACATALLAIVVWAALGPLFDFSETWQLVINTGTTIVTFVMVFVIQQSQNKDSTALHLKLNELIASHVEASNRLISIESFDKEELELLHRYYLKLAHLAEQENGVKTSHSLGQAQNIHEHKKRRAGPRTRAPAKGDA